MTEETATVAVAPVAAQAAPEPTQVDTGLVNLAGPAPETAAPSAQPVAAPTEPIKIAEPPPSMVQVASMENAEPVLPDKWWELHPSNWVKIAEDFVGKLVATETHTIEELAHSILSKLAPAPHMNPAPPLSETNPEEFAKVYNQATSENDLVNFTARLKEAQKQPDPTPTEPPQVAARVLAQTTDEINAGRKMVEQHAEAQAKRFPPVPEKWDGRSTPVFRPDAFTEYKNTFKSASQTPDKATNLPPKG